MTAPFDPATGAALVDVVDTMVTVPSSRDAWQSTFAGLIRDPASADGAHPASHLFADVPVVDGTADFVAYLLAEMDRYAIATALMPVAEGDLWGCRGVAAHPDRLAGVAMVDPNDRRSLAALTRLVADGSAVAAAVFPAGTSPQVGLGDAAMYPVYARCVELDIPLLVNVGVPGPRLPLATQRVEPLDRVCLDFDDLTIVTRHGGEPWERLLVELMRRHRNLHYSTSAFAPRHYPEAVIGFANHDGADQVLYAGYFPSGLSLDRIFAELPSVPLADATWPRFLGGNARRIFRLGDGRSDVAQA